LTGWIPMNVRLKTLARLCSPDLYLCIRRLTRRAAGGF
jgi:hypothetical protein